MKESFTEDNHSDFSSEHWTTSQTGSELQSIIAAWTFHSRTVDFQLRPVTDDDLFYDYTGVPWSGYHAYELPMVAPQAYNLYDGDNLVGSITFGQPQDDSISALDHNSVHVETLYVDEEYRDTNAFWELIQPAIQMSQATGLPIKAEFENEKLERVFLKALDRGKLPMPDSFVPKHHPEWKPAETDWEQQLRPEWQTTTHVVAAVHDELIEQVRDNLSEDLLKPQFRESEFPTGHCYVATEALYHLLGGAEAGYKPMRLRMPDGVTHWWLQGPEGVIDATHDQFHDPVPYEQGRGGGFLTREPSKRAVELMRRVMEREAASIIIEKYARELPLELREVAYGTDHFDYEGDVETWTYESEKYKAWNVYDGDKLIGSMNLSVYPPLPHEDPEWEETGMVYVDEIFVLPEYRDTNAFWMLIQPALTISQETGLPLKSNFANEKLERVFMKAMEKGKINVDPKWVPHFFKNVQEFNALSGYEQQKEAMPYDNNTWYHVTDKAKLPDIAAHGLRGRSHETVIPAWEEYPAHPDAVYLWPNFNQAWSYVEGMQGNPYRNDVRWQNPVVLRVTGIDRNMIAPDHENVEPWYDEMQELEQDAEEGDYIDPAFAWVQEWQKNNPFAYPHDTRFKYDLWMLETMPQQMQHDLARGRADERGDSIMYYGVIPPQNIEVAEYDPYSDEIDEETGEPYQDMGYSDIWKGVSDLGMEEPDYWSSDGYEDPTNDQNAQKFKWRPLAKTAAMTFYRVTPSVYRDVILEDGLVPNSSYGAPKALNPQYYDTLYAPDEWRYTPESPLPSELIDEHSGWYDSDADTGNQYWDKLYLFQKEEDARIFAEAYRHQPMDLWRVRVDETDIPMWRDPRSYERIELATGNAVSAVFMNAPVPPENVQLIDTINNTGGGWSEYIMGLEDKQATYSGRIPFLYDDEGNIEIDDEAGDHEDYNGPLGKLYQKKLKLTGPTEEQLSERFAKTPPYQGDVNVWAGEYSIFDGSDFGSPPLTPEQYAQVEQWVKERLLNSIDRTAATHVMYHLAPQSLRSVIEAEGLRPAKPERWGPDANVNPEAVYLFPSVEQAEFRRNLVEYVNEEPCDLWRVEVDEVEPDKGMANSYYSVTPIDPGSLTIVEEEESPYPWEEDDMDRESMVKQAVWPNSIEAAANVMYHVAAPKDRESILRHGIDFRHFYGEEDDIEETNAWLIEQGYGPRGNYLQSYEQALIDIGTYGDQERDIWEVNTNGLTLIPDKAWYTGYYTTEPIDPTRLRLLNSIEDTRTAAYDLESLKAQVAQIADMLDVDIWYKPITPGEAFSLNPQFEGYTRTIVVPPITDELSYATVLHELGHFAIQEHYRLKPSRDNTQEEETWVLHFVLEHARIPLSQETLEQMHKWNDSYRLWRDNPQYNDDISWINREQEEQMNLFGPDALHIWEQTYDQRPLRMRYYHEWERQQRMKHGSDKTAVYMLSPADRERLTQHIEELARQHGTHVQWFDVGDMSGYNVSVPNASAIYVAPIITDLNYLIALHEVGHAAFDKEFGPAVFDSIEEELWNDHFALEHSLIPFDEETLALKQQAIDTYYAHPEVADTVPVGWVTQPVKDRKLNPYQFDEAAELDLMRRIKKDFQENYQRFRGISKTAAIPFDIEPVDDSCYLVAANYASKYPELEYVAGQYGNEGAHAWLQMGDTIIDPTHMQYDEAKPMQVLEPGDPGYEMYRSWRDNPTMPVDWDKFPEEFMEDNTDPMHWLFIGKPDHPVAGPSDYYGVPRPGSLTAIGNTHTTHVQDTRQRQGESSSTHHTSVLPVSQLMTDISNTMQVNAANNQHYQYDEWIPRPSNSRPTPIDTISAYPHQGSGTWDSPLYGEEYTFPDDNTLNFADTTRVSNPQNDVHLSLTDDAEDTGRQIMYHMAPVTARESIFEYGLHPELGERLWQGDQFTEENYPKAIYLFKSLKDMDYSNPSRTFGWPGDVWEVNVEGLNLEVDPLSPSLFPEDDPEWKGLPQYMMVREPIPPERLRLLGTENQGWGRGHEDEYPWGWTPHHGASLPEGLHLLIEKKMVMEDVPNPGDRALVRAMIGDREIGFLSLVYEATTTETGKPGWETSYIRVDEEYTRQGIADILWDYAQGELGTFIYHGWGSQTDLGKGWAMKNDPVGYEDWQNQRGNWVPKRSHPEIPTDMSVVTMPEEDIPIYWATSHTLALEYMADDNGYDVHDLIPYAVFGTQRSGKLAWENDKGNHWYRNYMLDEFEEWDDIYRYDMYPHGKVEDVSTIEIESVNLDWQDVGTKMAGGEPNWYQGKLWGNVSYLFKDSELLMGYPGEHHDNVFTREKSVPSASGWAGSNISRVEDLIAAGFDQWKQGQFNYEYDPETSDLQIYTLENDPALEVEVRRQGEEKVREYFETEPFAFKEAALPPDLTLHFEKSESGLVAMVKAEVNGQYVGHLYADYMHTVETGQQGWLVRSIRIQEPYRRMGLGTLMLDKMQGELGTFVYHDWNNQTQPGRNWALKDDPVGYDEWETVMKRDWPDDPEYLKSKGIIATAAVMEPHPWNDPAWLKEYMQAQPYGYGDHVELENPYIPFLVLPDGRHWIGWSAYSHTYEWMIDTAKSELGVDYTEMADSQGSINFAGNEYKVNWPSHGLHRELEPMIEKAAVERVEATRKHKWDNLDDDYYWNRRKTSAGVLPGGLELVFTRDTATDATVEALVRTENPYSLRRAGLLYLSKEPVEEIGNEIAWKVSSIETFEPYKRLGIAQLMLDKAQGELGDFVYHDWNNQSNEGRGWALKDDPWGYKEWRKLWPEDPLLDYDEYEDGLPEWRIGRPLKMGEFRIPVLVSLDNLDFAVGQLGGDHIEIYGELGDEYRKSLVVPGYPRPHQEQFTVTEDGIYAIGMEKAYPHIWEQMVIEAEQVLEEQDVDIPITKEYDARMQKATKTAMFKNELEWV